MTHVYREVSVRIRVHIVEVYDKSDSERSIQEGPLLVEYLKIAGIPSSYHRVESKEEFFHALQSPELLDSEKDETVPILHIAGHGNRDGVGEADKWFVDWNECRDYLRNLNGALHGALILCVSSCFGTSALKIVRQHDEPPFFALIGNYEAPTAQDCAIAFVSFYHLLSVKGLEPAEAVRGMNAAAGETGFQFLPALQTQQEWRIHLENEKMLKDILDRSKLSGDV